MTDLMERMTAEIGPVLLNVLGALAILVVGYIVARLLSALVRKALQKTTLDDKLANTLQKGEPRMELERPIARGVFYVVMTLVFVAVLQVLQLTFVTAPLNEFLETIFGYLPQLIAAGVLVVVAYIVASVLRLVVRKGLHAVNVDERLVGATEEGGAPTVALSDSVATAVYYLVFLLFLPAILSTLELQGLLRPVEGLLDELLTFLPNIFAAAVIMVVGYFIAKLIRKIVTNLLAAIGTDRLSERVGLTGVLGKQKLSDVLGTIVYVLVLLPVIIAALNALSIDAVTAPASEMLDMILAAIPQILAAAVVLIIAYVIGKLVGGLVSNVLSGIGFNGFLSRIGLWNDNGESGRKTPSDLVGALVMVAILLFAAIESANLLGFGTLTALISDFMVFAGQVLVGLVIFALGLYVAKLARSAIDGSGMAHAAIVATAAQVAIVVFVGAMALRQMGLANSIINLAFGIVLGAIALAAAIAFGIGGRDFAKRQLDRIEEDRDSG
ncbi:MAG: mechanosensitive ion channel [Rhodothermia bacterium]|nr:mechanosensitive ion channel [Rhodothermia bacterium]